MPQVKISALRFAAVPLFVSVLSLSGAFAAHAADDADSDMAPQTSASSSSETSAQSHVAQKMETHVEDRIKTLHDKLGITSSQESKFNDLAQAMRDNETNLSQLIQERHANPSGMTAIDDLESYEKIAQAHADGLQKLIPVFTALYNDMSDKQKAEADQVFGTFEGHDHKGASKKQG